MADLDYSIDDNFYAAVIAEDELGSVVRAHLHVEYLVDQLLAVHFPNVSALRTIGLDYSGRVHLLTAFGYPDSLTKPLQALGNLRNDFAHKLDFKLTADRVDSIYKTFDSDSKQEVQRIYDRLRHKKVIAGPRKIKSRSPKDQFTLYATNIRASLVAVFVKKTGKFPAGFRPRTPPSNVKAA